MNDCACVCRIRGEATYLAESSISANTLGTTQSSRANASPSSTLPPSTSAIACGFWKGAKQGAKLLTKYARVTRRKVDES